jgi:hypothetical protein
VVNTESLKKKSGAVLALRLLLEKRLWVYFLNFLLNPTRLNKPAPRRSMVDGSGIVAGPTVISKVDEILKLPAIK